MASKWTHTQELERFVTGQGEYTDDITYDGQLYLMMVRSSEAAASYRIENIEQVESLPGVEMVLHAGDLRRYDFKNIMEKKVGEAHKEDSPFFPEVPLFPKERVQYVGQGLMAVIATSREVARKAVGLCKVSYNLDSPVVSIERAKEENALVYPEFKTNLAAKSVKGSVQETEEALKRSFKTFTLTIKNPRVVVNSLEPRCCNARFDAKYATYKLLVSSQGVHQFKRQISGLLKDSNASIEVETKDVGGRLV